MTINRAHMPVTVQASHLFLLETSVAYYGTLQDFKRKSGAHQEKVIYEIWPTNTCDRYHSLDNEVLTYLHLHCSLKPNSHNLWLIVDRSKTLNWIDACRLQASIQLRNHGPLGLLNLASYSGSSSSRANSSSTKSKGWGLWWDEAILNQKFSTWLECSIPIGNGNLHPQETDSIHIYHSIVASGLDWSWSWS